MPLDDQAAAADPSKRIAELQRERDEALARAVAIAAERDEALEQQTEFPPSQKSGSFSVDEVLDQLLSPGEAGH